MIMNAKLRGAIGKIFARIGCGLFSLLLLVIAMSVAEPTKAFARLC